MTKMLRRTLAVVLLGFVAVAIGASVALAAHYYAGPKTWLPGYDAGGSYSTSWVWDTMGSKSCWCSSRVAFIDGGGSWHASYTDALPNTSTYDPSAYNKKGYCLNNSGSTYTATCWEQ